MPRKTSKNSLETLAVVLGAERRVEEERLELRSKEERMMSDIRSAFFIFSSLTFHIKKSWYGGNWRKGHHTHKRTRARVEPHSHTHKEIERKREEQKGRRRWTGMGAETLEIDHKHVLPREMESDWRCSKNIVSKGGNSCFFTSVSERDIHVHCMKDIRKLYPYSADRKDWFWRVEWRA